jgi:hypothetical protein
MQEKTSGKNQYFRPKSSSAFRKPKRKEAPAYLKPEVSPVLKNVLAQIGKPHPAPFVPDDFQLQALEAIKKTDCLVIAPTGSGKTWIAREAILSVIEKGGRAWYASPLKALSNSKWVEFGLHFDPENVGIITGDTKENTEAPIIVGTTEILRNQLYDAMHHGFDHELRSSFARWALRLLLERFKRPSTEGLTKYAFARNSFKIPARSYFFLKRFSILSIDSLSFICTLTNVIHPLLKDQQSSDLTS